MSREDPEAAALWPRRKRGAQSLLPRRSRFFETKPGRIYFRELSRMAARLHVGHKMSSMPGKEAASGKPGSESQWIFHRRFHCPAGFAGGGNSSQNSTQ